MNLSSHTFFELKHVVFCQCSKDSICDIILASSRPTSATRILGDDKYFFAGITFCLCHCLMLHNWPTNLRRMDLREPRGKTIIGEVFVTKIIYKK